MGGCKWPQCLTIGFLMFLGLLLNSQNNLFAETFTVTFTVTFDSDGGSEVASQTVESGGKATRPTTDPEREGCVFIGWFKDGTEFEFDNTAITGATTLKAKWNYEVTFDPDGGSPAPEKQTVEPGGKATKPTTDPKREGCVFIGWLKDGTEFEFGNTEITEPITLKAKWNYEVTFDPAEGSPAPEKQTVEPGGKATKPTPDPEREGYVFMGWFKDGTEFDFDNTEITEPITLKAKWGYTVIFDPDEGKWGDRTTGVKILNFEPGTTSDKWGLPGLTKEGYVFMGWFDENGAKVEKINGPTTLKAKWNYEVTFDPDGGSPAPEKQTVEPGGKATKPTTDPKREGCVFIGWFKVIGATDGTLADDEFDFDNTAITGATTLKAKWNYEVTFDPDGGTPAPSQQGVKFGEYVKDPGRVYKAGYYFLGWYDGSNKFDFSTPPNRSVKLKAQFVEKVVTYEQHPFYYNFYNAETSGTNPREGAQVLPHHQYAPSSDTKIPETVYNGYNNVWYKVTEIVGIVRKKDTDIKSITIPSSVISIIENAFGGLPNCDVIVSSGCKFEHIGKNALAGVASVTILGEDNAKISETISTNGLSGYKKVTFEKWVAGSNGTYTKQTVMVQYIRPNGVAKDPSAYLGGTASTWYDGSSQFVFTTQITRDMTLRNIQGCVVTFDPAGGSAVASQTVAPGEKAKKPEPDPEKAGYVFVSWLKNGTEFDFNTAITGPTTLVAKWNPIVTFDPAGGIWADDTTSKTREQAVASGTTSDKWGLPGLTKEGYVFMGWFDEDGNKVEKITEPIALKAGWNPIVTFDPAGGIWADDTTSKTREQAVVSGTTSDKWGLPELTKESYAFGGWFDEDGNKVEKITGPITLVARWNPIVTFDPGEGGSEVESQAVASGGMATEPTAPEKAGYEFIGWFNGETEFNFTNTPITEPITLTAKWIEVVHLVFSKVFTGNVDIAEAFLSAGKTDEYDENKIKAFFEKNFRLYRGTQELKIGTDVSYDGDKIEDYISASVDGTEFTFTVSMRVLGNDTYTIKELAPKDNIYKVPESAVTFVPITE